MSETNEKASPPARSETSKTNGRDNTTSMLPVASEPIFSQFDNIPLELKSKCSWVGFKANNGNKTPCIADTPHRKASSTNPQTWRTYGTAIAGLRRGDYDAIGYALNGEEVGIDLDDCFDGKALKGYAAEIVTRCSSYSERSFSGNGVHILLTGSLDRGFSGPGVEVYGRGRFFICTGNHLTGTPKDILPNPKAVEWLINAFIRNVTEITETTETAEDIVSPSPPLSAVSVTLSLDDLIQKTLPQHPGERNFKIFAFARGLKFNMDMAGCSFNELKPLVRKWHSAALPVIRTKDFCSTWTDFTHSWPLADHPIEADILTAAWEKSRAEPLPVAAGEYDHESVKQLVGLCAALGSFSRDGRFFLSTHSAARLLNTQPMTVHRWLKTLVVDGLLELIHRGNERRASRYRWLPPSVHITDKGES